MIVFENGRYVVTPSADGESVDGAAALAQALAALDTTDTADTAVTIEAVVIPAAVTTPDATAAVARAEAVTSEPLYLGVGATTETLTSDTLRGWVRLEETGPGAWALVVAREPIEQLIGVLKAQTDQPAVDAEFGFEHGEPVAVPGQTGYELDAAASVDLVYTALTERETGTPSTRVTLPVLTTLPALSTEEAEALVSRVELLGSWTTKYVPSEHNHQGQNIRRPAELINGTVVQPGEEFDFVGVAGPITFANGYGEGAAIIHGKTRGEGVLGGGLCSASTTLFNAAMRAGFDIGARRNHAYYIDRYPVGLDATIWISGSYVQTTEFFNDTEYPVVVRGINKKKSVTFEIWGISDGRTVTLSDPVISNERESKNYYQFTDELAPRVQERVEYAADGFISVVNRTVRDANGNVIHTNTWRSNYRKVDGIILVGRAPGDPPAGTRILVSQGLPPLTPPPTPTPTPDPDADTAPVAQISVVSNSDGVVQVRAKKGDGWTYSWSANAQSAVGRTATFTFEQTDSEKTVDIHLTVTDADGDVADAVVSVTIPPLGT
jgi:vancomycin resistance protein YoaR